MITQRKSSISVLPRRIQTSPTTRPVRKGKPGLKHRWQFWLLSSFLPHRKCQSEVVQTILFISSLTIWLAKESMLHPIKIKTSCVFMLYFHCWFFFISGGYQSILPTTLITFTIDLQYPMSLNLKVSFLAVRYSNGTWHMITWYWIVLNRSFHLFMAKQDMSECFTSNISIIRRSESKILRIITNAPWFVNNKTLHTDLNIPYIKYVINVKCTTHCNKEASHSNAILQTLVEPQHNRRLWRNGQLT
jgi:hypothetical protein